jgi:sialic acid synthase SpsE
MKRPSNGISPYDEDIIIGKTLKMDVEADHQFQLEDFQID